jgi:hypothetical protein
VAVWNYEITVFTVIYHNILQGPAQEAKESAGETLKSMFMALLDDTDTCSQV